MNLNISSSPTIVRPLLSLDPSADRVGGIFPLSTLSLNLAEAGSVLVQDGKGQPYFSAPSVAKGKLEFMVAGALGTHSAFLLDPATGAIRASVSFMVDCQTRIEDADGRSQQLLENLYWTMVGWSGEVGQRRWGGKVYRFFVTWLRDHVHTLRGMKYYYPELKTGIELYADSQRADGMIWDNVKGERNEYPNMWENRFRYGDFYRAVPEDKFEFKRIPVENDVEWLFLEGLYLTWKATGDTDWMISLLPNAKGAVNYSFTNPYRWSEKYQLLKRGYTIDTWDFQSSFDTPNSDGDPMVVYLNRSQFGVMHGDNTGMAMGLLQLAEMLEVAGQEAEAKYYREKANGLMDRLNRLSWNGDFFTHHVPENPDYPRDFGVDTDKQISLSNAYALNRPISHEQAAAIIRSYQKIRDELPEGSPGEFYQIYPPFERGFGGHGHKWEYMNGGVTTLVAGELARGAFEHGFEEYGVDILNRIMVWAEEFDGYLPCSLRGAAKIEPERNFEPLSLSSVANADVRGNTVNGVLGWTGEGDNDLHEFPGGRQVFEKVPFDVVDPEVNGRRMICVLSNKPGFAREIRLAAGERKAAAVYLLQAKGGGPYAGSMTLEFSDGSSFTDEIGPGKIGGWWTPTDHMNNRGVGYRVAWRGKNAHCINVGCYIYGVNNPSPDKSIRNIVFRSALDGTNWMVMGVTLSDCPVYFTPRTRESFGIPDNWGAGEVASALIEGLVGVRDEGPSMDPVRIAPRWTAARTNKARAFVKIPASNSYAAYDYSFDPGSGVIELLFTGSGRHFMIELLLPESRAARRLTVNGKEMIVQTRQIEQSRYVVLHVSEPGLHKVSVETVRVMSATA